MMVNKSVYSYNGRVWVILKQLFFSTHCINPLGRSDFLQINEDLQKGFDVTTEMHTNEESAVNMLITPRWLVSLYYDDKMKKYDWTCNAPAFQIYYEIFKQGLREGFAPGNIEFVRRILDWKTD